MEVLYNFPEPEAKGYFAHGIKKIGKLEDRGYKMDSLYAWVRHLRNKNWWTQDMEDRFVDSVKETLLDENS